MSEALSSAELYVPPASSTFFVPVVLSAGGFGGSFFTSELILANRSANDVTVEFDLHGSLWRWHWASC